MQLFLQCINIQGYYIYTNMIEKFKYKSKRGYQYIFLTYRYDSNTIIVRQMKSCKVPEILEVLIYVYEYLKIREFKPHNQILGNKILA